MKPADYEQPGSPRPYGNGDTLPAEDREFLKRLDSQYWRPLAPDRHGRRGSAPSGKLTRSELVRVSRLILAHRLPTRIGSGMYGLSGYSMQVYDNPEPSLANERPERLLTIMSDHIPTPGGRDSQRHWVFFTGFTHSPVNLALLEFYGMEKPRSRRDYDY